MIESLERKPVVLIVEDNVDMQTGLAMGITPYAEVLQAYTLEDAERILLDTEEKGKDISVILMDGSLTKGDPTRPDTIPLIKKLRKDGFKGLIIAMSALPESSKLMVKAGCNYSFDKVTIFRSVLKLITGKDDYH